MLGRRARRRATVRSRYRSAQARASRMSMGRGAGLWREAGGLAPSRKPAACVGSAQRDRHRCVARDVGLRCANPTTLCLLSFPAFRV
jgi:hypothetical protein